MPGLTVKRSKISCDGIDQMGKLFFIVGVDDIFNIVAIGLEPQGPQAFAQTGLDQFLFLGAQIDPAFIVDQFNQGVIFQILERNSKIILLHLSLHVKRLSF